MPLVHRCVFERLLRPGSRPGADVSERAQAQQLRQQGNGLYAFGDVEGALQKYSECLAIDAADHAARAQRSHCWLQLGGRGGDAPADCRAEDALDDAEICVALAPRSAAGYLRRGAAEARLGRGADARVTYEAGLALCAGLPGAATDADVSRLREAHALLCRRSETSVDHALRAAMYRAMLVSPTLEVEGVFELLQESPDRLTNDIIRSKAPQLERVLGYLAKTLECDIVVLRKSRPLREAYDRATFACGQLVASAPGAASELKCARRVVDALRHAMYAGWRMESRAKSHGVAKFAANALTVVATAADADDAIRRRCCQHVLQASLAWLADATPEPHFLADVMDGGLRVPGAPDDDETGGDDGDDDDNTSDADDDAAVDAEHARLEAAAALGSRPAWLKLKRIRREQQRQQRQRVVCGCGALSPRLSAATWLERLFERGAPRWLRDECEQMVDAETLALELCVVVRDERAAPLGLPGFVRCVAKKLMDSKIQTDLFVRPEWRWDAALRVAAEADADADAAGDAAEARAAADATTGALLPTPRGHDAGALATSVTRAGIDDSSGEATPAAAGSAGKSRVGESDASLARRLQRAFDDEAVRKSRSERQLPPRRLGEWLAASLGYLILFIEGDDLFAATACAALKQLATADAAAAGRVCRGVWSGVPLLEKLSSLACKDAAAVRLLEVLAQRSPGARVAMLSLAAALAGESLADGATAGPPAEDADAADGVADADAGDGASDAPSLETASDGAGAATVLVTVVDDSALDEDHDETGAAPTPSWSEYFHEIQGTLGVGKKTGAEASADDRERRGEGTPEDSDDESMVLLSNFEVAALELPITGELAAFRLGAQVLRIDAVPAAWNERFADAVTTRAGLSGDPDAVLGSEAWKRSVSPGGCVVVERSAIRRSPAAPDWATAVQLCADAGASAAVVVNDLDDDGKAQPAFRMGVFGAARPDIAGFMVCGADGARLRALQRQQEADGRAADGGDAARLRRARSESAASDADEPPACCGCADGLGQQMALGLGQQMSLGDSFTAQRRATPGEAPAAQKRHSALLEIDVRTIRNSDVLARRHSSRNGLDRLGGAAPADASGGAAPADASGGAAPADASGGAAAAGAPSAPSAEVEAASSLDSAPIWPLRGVPRDVAQAWALAEVAHAAAPEARLAAELARLALRMDAAEKRVWLARRLQRHHCGRRRAAAAAPDDEHVVLSSLEDDDDEPALAFVECDRHSPQLPQLRRQYEDATGLGADDITGDFEVRFKGESAVGSAVLREWMDRAALHGAIRGGGRLLVTTDGGRSFSLNGAAMFFNPCWKVDFEMLGRLVGLALWQQVTLDLPLHASLCRALLDDGQGLGADDDGAPQRDVPPRSLDDDLKSLSALDSSLAQSLRWILANDVEGLDLPFTDALCCDDFTQSDDEDDATEADHAAEGDAPEAKQTQRRRDTASEAQCAERSLAAEDRVVTPAEALPGDAVDDGAAVEDAAAPAAVAPAGARVALCAGGAGVVVTNENKAAFAVALCDWRLRASQRAPVGAMLKGLHAAVPGRVLRDARKMLSPTDLAHLLSGLRDVDVADWRANTRYAGGLRPEAQHVQWFWQTVLGWAETDKGRLHGLLQFATGSRRVPVGGFAHLVGLNGGKHPFTLASGAHLSRGSLPTAHACICTIDLPKFESLEAARSKLQAAVEVGTLRFDEHATPDDD